MANREISTGRKRNGHPQDWCVDESWVAWQLFKALGEFRQEREAGEAIWDPCAGSGRTLSTFVENGFTAFAGDIVDRRDPEQLDWSGVRFHLADFLDLKAAPAPCSIVFNPPYSYIEGIAERFVRHALTLSARRVCAVMPIKWQGSLGRYQLFVEDFPPQAILVSTQRPSMPPGDLIPALTAIGKAFKGGVVDYAWYIWDVQQPTPRDQTRVIWLPRLSRPDLLGPIEGLA